MNKFIPPLVSLEAKDYEVMRSILCDLTTTTRVHDDIYADVKAVRICSSLHSDGCDGCLFNIVYIPTEIEEKAIKKAYLESQAIILGITNITDDLAVGDE